MRTLITELHKNTTKMLKCKEPKGNKFSLAAKTCAFKSLPPTTIWEDNASCLVLATEDNKYRPRTKHIAVKYHHFRDPVKMVHAKCKRSRQPLTQQTFSQNHYPRQLLLDIDLPS